MERAKTSSASSSNPSNTWRNPSHHHPSPSLSVLSILPEGHSSTFVQLFGGGEEALDVQSTVLESRRSLAKGSVMSLIPSKVESYLGSFPFYRPVHKLLKSGETQFFKHHEWYALLAPDVLDFATMKVKKRKKKERVKRKETRNNQTRVVVKRRNDDDEVVTIVLARTDLHEGSVKQIVGASLGTDNIATVNHTATEPPSYFADLYKKNALHGAHVIKLGPKNDDAAREALQAWPNGLQLGGGITIDNAMQWLDYGAEKVIVTSWLFPDAAFSEERLRQISEKIGTEKLVVDVSCKQRDNKWIVAMNKWQTLTDMDVNEESLGLLSSYCSEFLVHAADVEGLQRGIDEQLVAALSKWSRIPCTYAGGAKDISDIDLVNILSNGRIDLTYGSALDIFGGKGVTLSELVAWNQKHGHSR
ncbi:1-(5-phosphoribosyl)-5-[(5-phosphoribosylamino)methylideneamino]imidazole-4-carboxamide isomerase [Synchytrium microbalum]|uniref:1-(5-phosphoribosyl)-5-[(5-phosphoribosylamino)methylideneamino] imidazole-4-carboxamide isomerase n=1 Tax=Synchytrium microbalum TaxID=1806994 RepID=A0A507BLG3_9FUNG|nr:1-(5-phosphoribosyl)-5-[(5-phosphoribosylamino)methylideneamino]imidazole-4-carboxamide isomerase [Synchytrium microbalum]TPX30557.1 1-(5-phosphoribosyl)-5-[(5-phosphoribosylamino)methylideneamino]imidazole-4-carboxamide isomerase [Synchytrium microbalum]